MARIVSSYLTKLEDVLHARQVLLQGTMHYECHHRLSHLLGPQQVPVLVG
jgi:hypothetical protein